MLNSDDIRSEEQIDRDTVPGQPLSAQETADIVGGSLPMSSFDSIELSALTDILTTPLPGFDALGMLPRSVPGRVPTEPCPACGMG